MKKIVTIILTLAMILSCGAIVISAEQTTPNVWDGTSISYDWYLNAPENATEFYISSAAELAGLASLVNDGTAFAGMDIYLTADIYLNANSENYKTWGETAPANNWTAIGTNGKPFKGRFDGQGHTVYGMYIGTSNGDNHVGLFGCLNGNVSKDTPANGCGIKNLRVVNSYIASTAEGSHNRKMGMIAGQYYIGKNYVNIMYLSNVYTHGIIAPKYGETKNEPWVSGMVALTENDGYGTMLFENLVSDVQLTTNFSAGGIIGGTNDIKNEHADKKMVFNNLVNLGDITVVGTHEPSVAHAGGIFAELDGAIIATYEVSNCINLGNVKNDCPVTATTKNSFAGGIIGRYERPIKMDNVINCGTVTGVSADPIIGGVQATDVTAPVVTGAYTTTEAAGAYATKVADASIKGANALSALTGFGDWVTTADYPMPSVMAGYLAGKVTLAKVRLAATQETAAANGKIKVRLIGAIDSLDYTVAGFDVKVGSAAAEEKTTKTVSTYVGYNGGKAAAFDNYITSYVYAVELGEISATGTVVIEATAFVKGVDGAKVSAAKYTVTYTDGAFVSAVVSQ